VIEGMIADLDDQRSSGGPDEPKSNTPKKEERIENEDTD
jgi:hypothetical protein